MEYAFLFEIRTANCKSEGTETVKKQETPLCESHTQTDHTGICIRLVTVRLK